MEYKYTYDNIVEREKIINDNDFLYILKDERLIDGNYITFTDNKPLPLKETEIEVLENKIYILESENR